MHYPILLFSPVPMNIGINQNLFMNSKALHALTLVYGPAPLSIALPTLHLMLLLHISFYFGFPVWLFLQPSHTFL